jgi:hypothetical protein
MPILTTHVLCVTQMLPKLLKELGVWVSIKYQEAKHVILVAPTLAVAAHQPSSLQGLASLTVCSSDAEEIQYLMFDGESREYKALMAFLTVHLVSLDREGRRLWAPSALATSSGSSPPIGYHVYCLGRSFQRLAFNKKIEKANNYDRRPEGLHLLMDRGVEHATTLLSIVERRPLADEGPDYERDQHELQAMLKEIQLHQLQKRRPELDQDVGRLARYLATDVRAWFKVFLATTEPEPDKWRSLLRYASLARMALSLLSLRSARFAAGTLLGFNERNHCDINFVSYATTAAQGALRARMEEAVTEVLLLLQQLIILEGNAYTIDLARVFDRVPQLGELLGEVIDQVEPDRPCALAAVRVLATVTNVLNEGKPEFKPVDLASLLKSQTAILQPLFRWFSRLRPVHVERGGCDANKQALAEGLSCLSQLFGKQELCNLTARALEQSSVEALGWLAQVVVGSSTIDEDLKHKVLQLADKILLAVYDRPDQLLSTLLAHDDAFFDAVGDATRASSGSSPALSFRAIEVFKKITKGRMAVPGAAVRGRPVPQLGNESTAQADGSEPLKPNLDEEQEEEEEESGELEGADKAEEETETQSSAELMAVVERTLVRVYASQRALCYYDPTLDAAARASAKELLAVEVYQRQAAQQQMKIEEEMHRVTEVQEALREAEDDNMRLREEVARLKGIAERAQTEHRTMPNALVNGQQQQLDGTDQLRASSSGLATPTSSRAASQLALHREGQVEDLEEDVQKALEEYEILKADKLPLQQVAAAQHVIKVMQLVNNWAYGCAKGPSRLPLVDLLGPAQYASPLHFLKEVLQNFNDCRSDVTSFPGCLSVIGWLKSVLMLLQLSRKGAYRHVAVLGGSHAQCERRGRVGCRRGGSMFNGSQHQDGNHAPNRTQR